MEKFTQAVKDFWNDEEGLTAVEYAVAGSLVSVGVIAAFTSLGDAIMTAINKLITAMGGTAATKPS
ncbi:Flp family type IVb pilin [Vibrio sp. DNB22_19_2]